jgi:putative ABC transport system substrate-binding protein
MARGWAALLALCGWTFAAQAQAPIAFVGFLNSGSPNERAHLIQAFREGLREGGYVDGRNVAVEYRWAEGQPERLPKLAAELLERKVAVIVATGSLAPGIAAKKATSTTPIVFTGPEDPVKLGLVSSLSRPGGNATGITGRSGALQRKRLQILKELIPSASRIVYLSNPNNPQATSLVDEMMAAAESLGVPVTVVNASSEPEIERAFEVMKQMRAGAALIASDAFFTSRREQIAALAARHALPASYAFREFPMVGGLMSYGPNIADIYRQAGLYTARILNGVRPADLPVQQSDKVELVVNIETAKTLRLPISRDFLSRVDLVIQ